MSYNEIYSKFIAFEEKYNPCEIEINGIKVWDLIRYEIYNLLMPKSYNISQEVTFCVKLKYIIKSLINIKRNPFLANKAEIIFYGHERRQLIDNVWTDIYIDPLIQNLSSKFLVLENHYRLTHITPVLTKNLYYTDFIKIMGRIAKKWVDISISEAEKQQLVIIETALLHDFGLLIDLTKTVIRSLLDYSISKDIFRKLLIKKGVNKVIIVVSYGKESFISACKSLNIPIWELQHGQIYSSHLGYDMKCSTQHTPDKLLTFGKYWHKNIGLKEVDLCPIGFPILQYSKNQYYQKRKKQIIFISQITIGVELSKFACLCLEYNNEYNIIYKLHPVEYNNWQNLYPWLKSTKIQVIDKPYPTLYELFATSHAQVGVYSTAIYEGLFFKLTTFILKTDRLSAMSAAIQSKLVTVVETPNEIYNKLISTKNNIKIDNSEINKFFTESPIENFNKLLKQ